MTCDLNGALQHLCMRQMAPAAGLMSVCRHVGIELTYENAPATIEIDFIYNTQLPPLYDINMYQGEI